MTYARHYDSGVWERAEAHPIAYSDGTESRILELTGKAQDVGVLSDELASLISDWPTEYHFSRSRHCLLRPLGIKPGDRILELGCGCGALTRYLGECGAQVDAVEGSPLRARTAAARCRELTNVRVFLDDLTRFASDSLYDWVLLIGVLEYAPTYSTAADPVHDYIEQAARYLAQEGRLVIAIENKLGLKYFNGCSEDHVARPYYGIQGLYGEKDPVTFGKKELTALLTEAGFPRCSFLYPFPDYKLPSTILTDAALTTPGFDACALLPWSDSRDYTSPTSRCFAEPLVQRELFANGLLADLANSFLVVASKTASQALHDPVLAWQFDVDCPSRLATQTTYLLAANGIEADQQLLNPSDAYASLRVRKFEIIRRLGPSRASDAPRVIEDFARAYARDGLQTPCIQTLAPWLRWLWNQSEGGLLDGDLFDCSPFSQGKWATKSTAPIGWVLARSIQLLLTQFSLPDTPEHISALIRELFASAQIPTCLDDTDIEHWLECEKEFQQQIWHSSRHSGSIDG